MKIDTDIFDHDFVLLLFVFAVGLPLDWYFYHPSEAHWAGVGAAFILLVIYQTVDKTRARMKMVEGKLDAILKKLDET